MMKPLRRLAYQANRLLWRITRPITVGVRILLLREETVLLVKHTYLDGWYLPGGGVRRGESLEQAMRREVAEEVGGVLLGFRILGAYSSFYQDKNDHVIIFVSDNFSLSGQTDAEIEQVEFFPLDHLPADISPGTRRRIEEYRLNRTPYCGIW